MSYRYDKATGDIVIDGWEQGIAVSPHKGIANMQAVNISTETGEVMCSYSRVQQSQIIITAGTITATNGNANLVVSGVSPASATLLAGTWITVSGTTITGIANGTYYVKQKSSGLVQLSSTYSGSAIVPGSGGTASFITKAGTDMGQPAASATETYFDGSTTQYRYYIVDVNTLMWVFDTGVTTAGIGWFLPDITTLAGATPTLGLAVYNGWLFLFTGLAIWTKPTSLLGSTAETTFGWTGSLGGLLYPRNHFALVGHQSTLYYTDGNVVGSIFANITASSALAPNLFSYGTWTAVGTLGTIAIQLEGTAPSGGALSTARIPMQFYTAGALPTDLQTGGTANASKVFFLEYEGGNTFKVFAAATGGAALDLATGASGTQYFNTLNPMNSPGIANIVISQQALTLPSFEVAQSMAEIGNQVIVGTQGNTIYQWDQVSPQAQGFVVLPENNIVSILTVNNMGYCFTGSRGNIYITNGSTASLAISVPDYCAGIPGTGTTSSYVEPYFSWGGTMYLRGRVYFSILDQTTSPVVKTGNCGGVWSFTPTNNLYIGQDTGLALRMENQNSYGTYNGVATVLLASQQQTAHSPQYWSGWYSSLTSPRYGIDFTASTVNDFISTNAVIETDAIPVGTMLNKKTNFQVEYKVAAPLVFPESVAIAYRQDATSAYTSLGTAVIENVTTNGTLSGYFTATFEKSQWVQLQITLIPSGAAPTATNNTFTRLTEVRIR